MSSKFEKLKIFKNILSQNFNCELLLKDANSLTQPDAVKQLANILKTNVRACQAVGTPYINQLGRIYLDMLNVYKVMSSNISEAIQQHGQSCAKQPLIKQMRVVKKESLNLISCWISKSTDPEMVVENLIPPLLDTILLDYQKNIPEAREAEVNYHIKVFKQCFRNKFNI